VAQQPGPSHSDNALAPRHIVRAALDPTGRHFLSNRREEVVATVRRDRLQPGELRI
jgi:hypothetical protein